SVVHERGTDGLSPTVLSKQLDPPERPGAPLTEQAGCAAAFWLMLSFGGGIASLLLAGYYYAANPVSNKLTSNVGIALVIGALLMIIGVEVLAATKRRATAANVKFIREGPSWQEALAKWDELYYC